MENCKEVATPIVTNSYMDSDEVGQSIDTTKFRGLIVSLLYLSARPNIQFSVCMCARFQYNPKDSHYKALKRILKYIKGTINVDLLYLGNTRIMLSGFSYSNFVGCKLDRKNTTEICHLLGSNLISWNNKKQACIALFTIKA